MLPPPAIRPPGSSILPPPLAPPSYSSSSSISKAATGGGGGGSGQTITGTSTVAKRPLAHNDRTLTAMVPASVMVKREAAAKGAAGGSEEELRIGPGFGLAPVQRPGSRGQQQKQQQSLLPPQLGRWGNAVTIKSVPAGGAAGKGAATKAGPGLSTAAGAPAAAAAAGAPKTDEKLNDFLSSLKDLGAFDE
jgi:hypothetical protein